MRRGTRYVDAAGLDWVRVSPRMVYVEGSRPSLAEGFTRRTFTTMIEGVRERAFSEDLIAPARVPVYRAEVFRKPSTCTRQMPADGLGMDTASDAEVPVALEATSCPFGP